MQAKTKYALSGTAAGLVNGLFGGGGGMVLVPLLNGWCGLAGKQAFATCVAAILPLSAVSAAVYLLRRPSRRAAAAGILPRCRTSSADRWADWWADSCSAGSASHGCGDCSPPFCCTAA